MRYAVSLAAAAFLAAAGLTAAGPPAYAAGACTGSTGVTVVVDFNSLGGGVQQRCVSGGGGDAASSLFPAVGFSLRYAQRQPGFVCRVNDVPETDPCVNTAPADAFWGLWWSPGDGSWRFSTLGTGSLSVPDGGLVAFSWDDVAGSATPSASAKRDAAPPEPSQPPAGGTGGGDRGGDRGDGDDQPGTGSPSAPPGDGAAVPPGDAPSTGPGGSTAPDTRERPRRDDDRRKRGDRRTDRERPSPADETSSAGVDADDTTTNQDEQVADPPSDDGLPGWLPPLLIGLLFVGAGVVLYLRRRPTAQ